MKTQPDARYRALPELSPYVRRDRYQVLKEDHKFYIEHLKKTIDVSRVYEAVDMGCGNGEMIYAFRNSFPHWKYTGFDFTPEFIDAAKSFKGLAGVRLETRNIFDVSEVYDLVFCSSVFPTFSEFEKPLDQLLSVCRAGGWLFIDGLFNRYDVEVRLQYCDNSNLKSRGIWRSDWNQHSRKILSEYLEGKVHSVAFTDTVMDLDMPPNPDIHINRFTFRDADGRNRITNGTNVLLNRTIMTIQK